jgi:diguanylate cyclase (GGDEF)-like protein
MRVLILEDSRADAQLLVRGLRKAGFKVVAEVVSTSASFERALGRKPELILADYHVPGFGALAALARVAEQESPPPVIAVSGFVGEEVIARTIKAGAADYLLKDRLTRLGAAVSSALREQDLRRVAARLEASHAQTAARLAEIVQNLTDAVLTLGTEGMLETVNPAAQLLFGPDADLHGVRIADLLKQSARRTDVSDPSSGELPPGWVAGRGVRRDGTTFSAEWCVSDIGGDATSVVVRDVSPRMALLSSLESKALRDPLTKLANRYVFTDRLEQAMAESKRSSTSKALMVVDLNDFKVVNDQFGHAAGDQLLRTVAARLKQSLRASDTVARLGGDEFGVLLAGATSEKVAVAIANKLTSNLNEPMTIGDRQLMVTASIGVALTPADGVTSKTLLSRADGAMYFAKQHGLDVSTVESARSGGLDANVA